MDIKLSAIGTSPSLSCRTTTGISGIGFSSGMDVNLSFPFPFDGERHGDGGTRVRSIWETGGTERARGVRIASVKADFGDGIDPVDDGFVEPGGFSAHSCSLLA